MAKQKKPKGSPFGETSRVELLEQHLDAFGEINAANAWRFVYEELLWFDRSTGLVHLYESDKVRPGRSSWYARSIAFTDRLAQLFDVDRAGLKHKIDRLFLACLERLVEGKAKLPGGAPIVAAVAEVGDELGIDPGVVEEAGQVAASEDFIPYAELLPRSPNCWSAAPAWTTRRRRNWPARSLIARSFISRSAATDRTCLAKDS